MKDCDLDVSVCRCSGSVDGEKTCWRCLHGFGVVTAIFNKAEILLLLSLTSLLGAIFVLHTSLSHALTIDILILIRS